MVALIAACMILGSGTLVGGTTPINPPTGGYDPIISLPPVPPPPPPPTGGSRPMALKSTVDSYTREVVCGTEGEMPGSVYKVHYNLAILVWNEGAKNWEPVPTDQVERTGNLKNPIVVSWRDPSHGKVKHGVKGKLTFKNLSKRKIMLDLYWVPGGDAYTPPDKESYTQELIVP